MEAFDSFTGNRKMNHAGRRALPSCLVLFALLCLGASQASAQNTYTVTRFDDTASAKDLRGLPGLGEGNAGDLRYGIQEAIAAGGEWTINFASGCTTVSPCTITLSNPLPPIESGADVVTESQNGWDIGSNPVYAAGTITARNQPPALTLTIDGGAFGQVILDGASAHRVFFVDSGTVTLKNLQIQNARAQGGDGYYGGGGGLGAGAGLFVNHSSAQVTVENSYFLKCAVAGGTSQYETFKNEINGSISYVGGGGGMAYGTAWGNLNAFIGAQILLPPAGGGGILSPGGNGVTNASLSNGGFGGGGAGYGSTDEGIGYGSNVGGSLPTTPSIYIYIKASNGGFGGGGGGNIQSNAISARKVAAAGGDGGFGGGGGGSVYISDSMDPTHSIAYFSGKGGAGGGGGGVANTGCDGCTLQTISNGGKLGNLSGGSGDWNQFFAHGGGGAAAGPAIFVNQGSVTIVNSGASGMSAVGGAAGGSGNSSAATAGGASSAPVFNYEGKVIGALCGNPPSSGSFASLAFASPFNAAATVNAGASNSFTVNALDTNGAVYLGYSGTVDLTTTNPLYSFSSNPLSISCGSGTAAFSMDSAVSGNTYSVEATDIVNSANSVTSGAITVNPAAANVLAVSVPATEAAGTAFSGITVTAYDKYGNLATSFNGTVSFTSSDPSAALPTATTLTNGTGSFSATLNTPGSQTITATSGTLTTTSPSIAVTYTPAATTLAATAGDGQSAFLAVAYGAQLQVYLVDQFNVPFPGATVTFTAPASGASAVFSNGSNTITTTTDVNGLAFTVPTANMTVGAYTVTASVAGTSLSASFSLTNAPTPFLVVTSTGDDAGDMTQCTIQTAANVGTDASCSLRDALLLAAYNGTAAIGFDSTVFATAQTISINANSPLTLPNLTSIQGPTTGSGATLTNLVTLDGGGATSAWESVNPGAMIVPSGTTSSISNLNIQNFAGQMGAINSSTGTLNLSGMVFSNNIGTSGGAIYNQYPATVNVSNSLFKNNAAAYQGGAINNTGTVTVTGSTFTGNQSLWGGAIYNGVMGIYGGADGTTPVTANFTLVDSTITGSAPLTNPIVYATSTFSGGGGALFNWFNGVLNIANSTVAGNTIATAVPLDAAGSFNAAGIANINSLTLNNSIVAGNTYTDGTATDIGNTQVEGGGTTGTTTGAGNLIGVMDGSVVNSGAALLAPLANYGGPTQTMLPLPGSAAICAGAAANIPGSVTTDQRGYARANSTYESGTVCVDAGAVQTNYALFFSTEPPAIVPFGQAMSPAPVVGLTESGAAATAVSSGSVAMNDSASPLSGTTSASFAAGAATFSNLLVSGPSSNDTLTASMALTPSLQLTAVSTNFQSSVQTQSIVFTDSLPASVAYNSGLTYAISATGGASGNPVTFSVTGPAKLSGSTLTVTGPGTVTVTANQAGSASYSAAPPATQSITIAPAQATVTVTPYAVTYDGNPHTATATATGIGGANLNFGAMLTGTTHTKAGTYSDTWSFGDASGLYAGQSGTVTDTILKATATVTLGDLVQTYSGLASPATATTTPIGLKVTFTYNGSAVAPSAVGTYTVVGTISDANYTGSATGNLVISPQGPPLTINPTTLNLGNAVTTQLSGVKTVSLTNVLPTAVSLGSPVVSGSGFALAPASTTCKATLAVKASCKIGITLTAPTLGAQTGSLTFTANGIAQTVTLAGTGENPTALLPAAENFGSVAINAPSEVKTVTLYNYQLATPLSIASIAAQPSNYAVSATTCGSSLAANSSCTVSLTVTPTAQGAVAAGTLTIATNAANGAVTVALSGTGENPAAVSPAAVNFGDVAAGAASAAKIVTLYNYQQTPLSIASIAAQPSNYAVSATTCGNMLAASSTCTITLTVTPAALGAVPAGTLTIDTNAANGPLTVTLSATGVNPTGVSSATENFGNVAINTASAVKTVTLYNYLLVPLSTPSVTVQPSNYAVTGGSCGSWMGPQSHCTITLTATPTGVGAIPAGTLTIATNAVNGPLTVTLSGTGVNPTAVSPAAENFGNVAIDTASAVKTVTLYNNLLTPLSIAATALPSNYTIAGGTCGSTLAAQSHCTITLTATPTGVGAIPAGTLTIDTNAGTPLTVTLSGKGIQ
jgi:hypothetical protein